MSQSGNDLQGILLNHFLEDTTNCIKIHGMHSFLYKIDSPGMGLNPFGGVEGD